MTEYTRREFLELSLAAAAGAVLMPLKGSAARAGYEGVLEVPAKGYPLIEVSGSNFDIGRMIGTAMKKSIGGHLKFSKEYSDIVAYLDGRGRDKIDRMFAHVRERLPLLLEEIEGTADTLEVPFMNIFAFNCRPEIGLLKDAPGCSTIALKDGDTAILAHNEDGNDLNIGRMFLLKATPPSGVTFLSFVYPGVLPGNGPGVNIRGIVQTTNYIEPYEAADGIPRYFLSRAALEAKTLDEAVEIATMAPRAFPVHHNFVSLNERRILSVECAAHPDNRHDVFEVEGLYVHTNHFIHPSMVGGGEAGAGGAADSAAAAGVSGAGGDGRRPYDVPYVSSTTRMDVLSGAIRNGGAPACEEEMMELLSLHEGRPYSPCRHPEGDVHGATLGTAVFAAPQIGMMLYHGNPCMGIRMEHKLDPGR